MIGSGGDGAERSHASAFPPRPDGGHEIGDAGDGMPDLDVIGDLTDLIDLGDLGGETGEGATGEEATGEEARVRSSLAPLERLPTLPVRDHVAVFEQVFNGLEATLATVAGEGRADAPSPGAVRGGNAPSVIGGGETGSAVGGGPAVGGGEAGPVRGAVRS